MNVGVTGKGTLRSRQRLGKYRIERQLAEGGFATVYRAMDTVEGIRVALRCRARNWSAGVRRR
ncbi:MAG: hypothetical protein R3B07_14090 [Polyangiaceae bacterium]